MNFLNYTDLKDSLVKALNRSDLSDAVPGFVTLCEAEIRRQVRRKASLVEVKLTSGEVTLPNSTDEVRGLAVTGPSPYRPVKFGTVQAVYEKRARFDNTTGVPQQAAVIGRKLILAPAPDQTYTAVLSQYDALVPLSSTNEANATLLEAPDIYFYGSLIHSAPYLKDDARLAMWQGLFDRAVAQLNAKRQREEFGASPQPARLPTVFG